MTRLAVYLAPPPGHALWAAGCGWLGRDARAAAPWPPAPDAARQAPWRYGFHATVVAPFEPRDASWTGASIEAALRSLLAGLAPFEMPALQVDRLDGFLALRPCKPLRPGHPLQRLAATCVLAADGWRAPLSPFDLARRTPPDASARERELLARHGYAHVLSLIHI